MKRLMVGIILLALVLIAGCGGGGGGSAVIPGGDPVFTDSDRSLIHNAVRYGTVGGVHEILSARPELLKATDGQGRFPIHTAFLNQYPGAMCSYLLSQGADPNTKRSVGLDWHYPIHLAAQTDSEDAVRAIHWANGDLNALNESHQTAVFVAVDNCSLYALEQLLSLGADGSIPDRYGETPYARAAQMYNGTAEVLAAHGYNTP